MTRCGLIICLVFTGQLWLVIIKLSTRAGPGLAVLRAETVPAGLRAELDYFVKWRLESFKNGNVG